MLFDEIYRLTQAQILASSCTSIFDDCIVDESSRVCLQPIRGVDGSDYINANFIHVSESSRNFNSCFFAISVCIVPLAACVKRYQLYTVRQC